MVPEGEIVREIDTAVIYKYRKTRPREGEAAMKDHVMSFFLHKM